MTERPRNLVSGDGSIAGAAPEEAVQRDALARLLERLSAPLAIGRDGRRLVPDPGQSLLSALLDEIDNTVMARCLRVEAPDGAALLLEISNRRLLHVSSAPGDDAGSEDRASVIGELGFASLEDLTHLRDLLDAHCAGGSLRVESLRPSGRVGVEQTGVSVATLRQAFASEEPTAPAQGSSLADYAIACGADALCWQASTGEAGGDEARQDALEEIWELWPEGLLATSGAPVMTILSPDDPSAPSLLLAQEGEAALAALLSPGCEPRVAALWMDLKAG